MKKVLLIIIIVASIPSLFCQNFKIEFEHLPDEPGLSDHEFKCIMQDHAGFIWMGGPTGLYRHNGYEVTSISDKGNCEGCSFGSIHKIVEDTLGLLWLLTDSGIKIYDPEKERSMLVYQHEEGVLWLTLFSDYQGNIWASDLAGLFKISYGDNIKASITKDEIFKQGGNNSFKIKLFQPPYQKQGGDNPVFALNKDEQGNIWVGCAEGLFFLKKGQAPFIRLDGKKSTGEWKEIRSVRKIIPVDENSVWILDLKGLYLLTDIKQALQGNDPDVSLLNFSLKLSDGENINILSIDRNKNFLVMVDKRIYLINKGNRSENFSLELIGYNTIYPNDIEQRNRVHDIIEDKSGVIWIAKDLAGVSKFKMNRLVFTKYEKLKIQNLDSIKICSIYEDSRENLWILVNYKAIYKIDRDLSHVTQYDPGQTKKISCFIPSSSNGLLWIGCNRGILEFNIRSGKFRDPLPQTGLADNLRKMKTLDMLDDGNLLYIATTIGLFAYNYKNQRIYKSAYSAATIIGSLIKMKNGEIWAVGNFYGIHKIEFNAKLDILYLTPVINKNKFIDAEIGVSTNYIFYEDNNGFLWIGNETGIHQLDPRTGKNQNYKLFENTDFQSVMSITADNNNNLWLGTYKKLCRLNMKTGKLKVFEEDDGVPFLNYSRNSVFKNKEGRIYFGGYGGFYSFYPDSFKTNDYVPPIVISDLRLFNKPIKANISKNAILTGNIAYAKSINLKHNQNDLSFEFASLDYNQPYKNKYAYKLEGYDREWIYTDAKSRIATYTNLDPRTYVFRVKGSNNHDVWNEEGTSLTVQIHKPWWATFFAFGIYILVVICLIFAYIRVRIWRLKKEKLELERQVDLRTRQIEEQKEEILAQRDMLEEQNQQIFQHEELKSRFFTNVSHEFRTPLSLIQSPVEELLDDPRRSEKERRKLNTVQRNVRRLINLVNQLLDISKLDGGKMKLELIEANVLNHLQAITGIFISLAETKSINYVCHFQTTEVKYWFDPDKLEKIAGNLLSNAFKFTPPGGDILFTASYKNSVDSPVEKYLEFSVNDTGPGIPAQSLEKIFDRFYQVEASLKSEGGGTGIGLSLTREITKLLHGDIMVESTPGKGSTFTVVLPLGKKHLDDSEFILLKEVPECVDIKPDLHTSLKETNPTSEEKPLEKKPIILVVEDNRDIRLQLADNLFKQYTILEAIDGVAGLKKAIESIPDLIITDLMMPHMDGKELCEKLKKDERTCHIPIIMLTAKVTLEDKITGYLTGADDYIPKPFHMAELKARVSNLIDQRNKLRERFRREITLQPTDISITSMDEKFLKKVMEVTEKLMNDETFDLNKLRAEMNMTRSTLFRKIRALTGQCPTEFIRTLRLKRAADLLKQNFGNVTQISLEVGFNNLSYFNRSFKKLFGVSPVEYAKSNGTVTSHIINI
jgi:signal transduction histidine kinase/DNA-binding response OmpR family regulator/ligand-binding sensor domain-containing protein